LNHNQLKHTKEEGLELKRLHRGREIITRKFLINGDGKTETGGKKLGCRKFATKGRTKLVEIWGTW